MYPPAMNLLNHLGSQQNCEVAVCSSHNDRNLSEYSNESVQFSRIRFPSRRLSRVRRLLSFLQFPVLALWKMLRFRPDVVLYIEPHSSFPAFAYRLLNWRHRLFIHYHEYYEPAHFQAPGMRLIAVYHWFEKRFLYRQAEWISQTNQNRVDFFLTDHPQVAKEKVHVQANYPPAKWASELPSWPDDVEQPLKLIYVGALSVEDTFIQEAIAWVCTTEANVTLDLFSNNVAASAQKLLRETGHERITHHTVPVPYHELPNVLRQYHVGLILYKANTQNYVYNASNKLFEYLTCGLDVIYPNTMLGVRPYATQGTFPRVIEADFDNLDFVDAGSLRSRDGLEYVPWKGACETEFAKLTESITQSD